MYIKYLLTIIDDNSDVYDDNNVFVNNVKFSCVDLFKKIQFE